MIGAGRKDFHKQGVLRINALFSYQKSEFYADYSAEIQFLNKNFMSVYKKCKIYAILNKERK